jgi:alpha-glucosidase
MKYILTFLFISGLAGGGYCQFSDTGYRLDSFAHIGAVSSVERTAGGVTFNCADGSQLRVSILAPDLARVRASFKKPLPQRDHSWAIDKTVWQTPEWDMAEQKDKVVLRTSEMEIDVSRSPLLVTFIDVKTGKVINADSRPLMYDANGAAVAAAKKLPFEEHYYGLGEKAARLDKRRGKFTMWNSDTPGYAEGKDPLYQDVSFYMGLNGGYAYGIFFDNSYRSGFDFGNSGQESAFFYADGGEMNYYFFLGPDMKKIVSRYTELTGRMPMPPLWALGHQQSRWSYYPATLVEELAAKYRKEDLPLDAIHLDIHYMNGYRVFTWDPQRFPDPGGLVKKLGAQGIKVVTIVDPGIKYQPSTGAAPETSSPELAPQDSSYYVYDEGVKNDYFLRNADGSQFIPEVWPGKSVFVDYTKPDAARWWGGLMKAYTKYGVAGIWGDMNEPSDFMDQTGARQLSVVTDDLGEKSTHLKNRNVFALLESSATYNGLLNLEPDKRPYVITRAGYAGIQRYSTVWTGDNTSTWDSLALSIPMLETLGLSGEAFAGSDIGGFAARGNGELLARWYQVSFLAPFCRNHKELSGYDQEPWRFGSYYENIIRNYLKLRYRLLPFLYTEIAAAHYTGVPALRPPLLNYQDDDNLIAMDDEFMVGDTLLDAPVLSSGRDSRYVYLPKGGWYDFWTREKISGGRAVTAKAPLETVPLYVRAGSVLPTGPEMNYTGEKPLSPLTFEIYPDGQGNAAGSLYEDDGASNAYKNGVFRRTEIKVAHGTSGITITMKSSGTYKSAPRKDIFRVPVKAAPHAVKLEGKPLPADSVSVRGGMAEITINDDGEAHTISLDWE